MKWKISKKSLTCAKCGHILNQDEVKSVRSGVPTSCHRCGRIMVINHHPKSEQIDRDDDISMVHPVGRLSIGQRVQPLEVEVQKFGDAHEEEDSESHDYIDSAAFQDMSDSEKLNTPSFEKSCPYCGYVNKSGNSVCEKCGASI